MSYQPEFIGSLFKVVFVLFFIIGGLWVASHYLKKRFDFSAPSKSNKRIKILESCHIGLKKSICLIQVAEETLVIGVAGDLIIFLTKMDKSDLTTGYDAPGHRDDS